MSAHTPGPWQSDGLGRIICVTDHKGVHGAWQKDVCSLRDRVNDLATASADAKLIAAAPDMVEALRAISNQARPRPSVPGGPCREYIIDRKEMEFLRAVLAKAGL